MTVVDLLTGWLGLAFFGAAVVLALALEVIDERATAGAGPAGRRGLRGRRALTGALVVLVLAALAATAARLILLGD